MLLSFFNLKRMAFKFGLHAPGMEFSPRRPFKSLRVFDNKRLYIMNRRWWNNEIICTVLRLNQRFFS
jgi:hypothetical protein